MSLRPGKSKNPKGGATAPAAQTAAVQFRERSLGHERSRPGFWRFFGGGRGAGVTLGGRWDGVSGWWREDRDSPRTGGGGNGWILGVLGLVRTEPLPHSACVGFYITRPQEVKGGTGGHISRGEGCADRAGD